MVTESQMYWMTRMDDLREVQKTIVAVAGTVGMVLMVILFVMLVGAVDGEDIPTSALKSRLFKWSGPVLLVLAILVGFTRALTPSTRDYAAIKVIPAVLNSEGSAMIRKDAGELYDLTVSWAKSQLEGTEEVKQK